MDIRSLIAGLSVLDKNIKTTGTTYQSLWKTSSNRVDANNVKARRRYDEVMKARLQRASEERERIDGQVRGRE